MKTYLINLDRSPDRLEWFMRSTKDLNLDVVRIAGVDGSALADRELEDNRRKRRRPGVTLGRADIGCFLSHREAWRRVAEGQDRWAFIAEDDIHFAPGAERFFSSDNWIPVDADIIKAETVFNPTRITIRNNPRAFGHLLRSLLSSHWGAGGYFINAQCAANLVRWTEDVCDLPDNVLFDDSLEFFSRLRIYQIDPAICIQDNLINSTGKVGLGSVRIDANIEEGVTKQPVNTHKKRTVFASLLRVVARPFEHVWRQKKLLIAGQWIKIISFDNQRAG
ncbi:glycosyltransferase family 25 protein [Hoeflea prorocentri]|uniref:Glycosyltransferase family 25 protein n=1 Tax=Hoeflea prorocentri TaxID=1922333 RepID=A0A9X3UK12_9HYPH|nr:glycosyltransferase family 25 protein [Hoeflea prorocentri]MCY6381997.1 glycosyltransferase family 25 protein [Hoeflea prorocentri]MDA5399797.1 glycosyltransferase family 25 protein [Hoeflea prorocentri]